jgi:hypothetical protein
VDYNLIKTGEFEVGMERYMKPDAYCDSNSRNIRSFVSSLIRQDATNKQKYMTIFHFVKDNIWFAGTPGSVVPASETIKQGFGSGSSKSILIVAMLRMVGFPARFTAHIIGCSVYSKLIPNHIKRFMRKRYLHLRPEIRWKKRWISLEGCILDNNYIESLMRTFPLSDSAWGFGLGYQGTISRLNAEMNAWDGENDLNLFGNRVIAKLGEVIDPTGVIEKHSKGSYLSSIIDKMISKKIGKLRTCL